MPDKTIAALWAADRTGRYPAQFIGAVAEGLRDAWYEESERIREAAEKWFVEFDPDEETSWEFHVVYQSLPTPVLASTGEQHG